MTWIDDDTLRPYQVVYWCNDCRNGRHPPSICTTGGLEVRPTGPAFRDPEAAWQWVNNNAAISKRAPFVFEAENVETGERVRLTGFGDSDWD